MRFSGLPVGVAAFLMLTSPVSLSRAFADDADTCRVGDITSKIAACTGVIKSGRWRGPELAWAYANRGHAYFDKRDIDHAISDFNEAIRLNSKYADAYVGRSLAYRAKGNNDAAVADHNMAIRLNPAEADRSDCARESGDTAIAACNRAITSGTFRGTELAAIFDNRGVEYSNKGLRDRAREDYSEAIRLNPKNFNAYNCRGDDYRLEKDYDHAIRDLDEAIRLNPSWAQAFKTRADTYRDKGDYDRAIQDYDQAIRLTPNYTAAINSRAEAIAKRGH